MADVMTIQGLTKNFGGLCAVDHFSMSITDDSIHALIGPNGSGKTTTINMISGVIPADSGSIVYKGTEVSGKSTDSLAKMGIIRTFQNIKLFTSMSALENTMVGGHSFTGNSMVLVTLLPELLRKFDNYYWLIFSAFMLVMAIFNPYGLLEIVRKITRYFRDITGKKAEKNG